MSKSITNENNFTTDSFQLTEGAQDGYVLTSDDVGKGSWQLSSGGGGGGYNLIEGNNIDISTSGSDKAISVKDDIKIDLSSAVFQTSSEQQEGFLSLQNNGKIIVNANIVTDNFECNTLKLNNNPVNGYVLSTDSDGNASWVQVDSISDQNHIAGNGISITNNGNDQTIAISGNYTGDFVGSGQIRANQFRIESTEQSALRTGGRLILTCASGIPKLILNYGTQDSTDRAYNFYAQQNELRIDNWNKNFPVFRAKEDDSTIFNVSNSVSVPYIFRKINVDTLVGSTLVSIDSNGKIICPNIQLTSSPSNNYILRSDNSGNASWSQETQTSLSQGANINISGSYPSYTISSSTTPSFTNITLSSGASTGKFLMSSNNSGLAAWSDISVPIQPSKGNTLSLTNPVNPYQITSDYNTIIVLNSSGSTIDLKLPPINTNIALQKLLIINNISSTNLISVSRNADNIPMFSNRLNENVLNFTINPSEYCIIERHADNSWYIIYQSEFINSIDKQQTISATKSFSSDQIFNGNIAFTNNSNARLNSPASNQLSLYTDSTERINISNNNTIIKNNLIVPQLNITGGNLRISFDVNNNIGNIGFDNGVNILLDNGSGYMSTSGELVCEGPLTAVGNFSHRRFYPNSFGGIFTTAEMNAISNPQLGERIWNSQLKCYCTYYDGFWSFTSTYVSSTTSVVAGTTFSQITGLASPFYPAGNYIFEMHISASTNTPSSGLMFRVDPEASCSYFQQVPTGSTTLSALNSVASSNSTANANFIGTTLRPAYSRISGQISLTSASQVGLSARNEVAASVTLASGGIVLVMTRVG